MEAVTTAITAAIGDATDLVTTSVPLILGVAVLFVGVKIGKRILGKI